MKPAYSKGSRKVTPAVGSQGFSAISTPLEITEDDQTAAGETSLFATLGNLATTIPEPVTLKVETKFKSRFFFRPSLTASAYVKKSKKTFEPKTPDHINAEILKAASTYQNELPYMLDGKIDKVRDYFLSNLAPIIYANDAGVAQAQDIASRVVGDLDNTMFVLYDRMLKIGVNMKLAVFVAKQLNLPKGSAEKILEALQPPKPITIPVPLGQPQAPHAREKPNEKQRNNQTK